VALQGTLETFALPDVLRLLASTKKTGCYRLDGDRGSGRLWVRDGQVVAGDVAHAPAVTDPAEVTFELLRFTDGEFQFQGDTPAPRETGPQNVESVLGTADQMLREWAEIEAIVPSLDTWVSLRAELPSDEVTIRADKWVSVVAVGGGCSVGQLGSVLGLGELPVSRIVKDLLDLGIVELNTGGRGPTGGYAPESGYAAPYGEPGYEQTEYRPESYGQGYESAGYEQPSYEAPGYEQPGYEAQSYEQQPAYEQPSYEQPSYEAADYEAPAYEQGGYEQPQYGAGEYDERYENDPRYATASYDEVPSDTNVIEFSPYESNGGYGNGYGNGSGYESYDASALVMDDSHGSQTAYDDRFPGNPPPPASRSTGYDTDPTDAAEIARQLANHRPRAAKAVAAAAKATTQAEREAALAQVDESEDSINRDLLLKFLGSVNS
jgi:hypothetical protein